MDRGGIQNISSSTFSKWIVTAGDKRPGNGERI